VTWKWGNRVIASAGQCRCVQFNEKIYI